MKENLKIAFWVQVCGLWNFKSRSRATSGKRLKEGDDVSLRHLLNVFRCSFSELISNFIFNSNENCCSVFSVYRSFRTIIQTCGYLVNLNILSRCGNEFGAVQSLRIRILLDLLKCSIAANHYLSPFSPSRYIVYSKKIYMTLFQLETTAASVAPVLALPTVTVHFINTKNLCKMSDLLFYCIKRFSLPSDFTKYAWLNWRIWTK